MDTGKLIDKILAALAIVAVQISIVVVASTFKETICICAVWLLSGDRPIRRRSMATASFFLPAP